MKTELLKKLSDGNCLVLIPFEKEVAFIRAEVEGNMPDDQEDKSVDTSDFLPFIDKKTGVSLIENRILGEYAYKSFFLNDDFEWEMKNDGNCLVLIPTRK